MSVILRHWYFCVSGFKLKFDSGLIVLVNKLRLCWT